jgi:hypothetical protein
MYTNDLLQSQLSLGAYAGATNPFSSPYSAAINPTVLNTLANPWQTNPLQQGYAGIPNYGAIAQQQQQLQQLQQLASILALQGAIPQLAGLSPQINPFQNQPFQNQPWQNQQQPNIFQNPLLNPILAQQLALQASGYGQPQFAQPQYGQPQYGQVGSVFGQQTGLPFGPGVFAQGGYPLAPQSWVGQPMAGQIHPHHLSHLAARGLY